MCPLPLGEACLKGELSFFLCANLCVLCVSVANYRSKNTTTEAQRTQRLHREELSNDARQNFALVFVQWLERGWQSAKQRACQNNFMSSCDYALNPGPFRVGEGAITPAFL
jgi:hypothetical protein